MKRCISFFLGLLISGVALAWVLWETDLHQVLHAVSRVGLLPLIVAAATYLLGFIWRAIRWKIMLSPLQEISTSTSAQAVLLGYAANNLLPLRLGELVRSHYAAKWTGCAVSGALASVLSERILDGFVIVLILAGSVFTMSVTGLIELSPGLARILTLGGAIFSAGMLCALIFALVSNRLLLWVQRFASNTQVQLLQNMVSALDFLRRPRLMFPALILSLLTWCTEAMVFSILMHSMGLPSPVLAGLFTMAVVNLGLVVPSAPGYVGVFQAATIFAFTILGHDSSLALAYSIAVHAVLFFTGTLAGLVAFLFREARVDKTFFRQLWDLIQGQKPANQQGNE